MSEEGSKRIRDRELYRAIFHPGERFRRTDLYRSVVRHPRPDTPRGRAMTSFHNFFLHLYPVTVPRPVLSFRSTFRLGFIAAVLKPSRNVERNESTGRGTVTGYRCRKKLWNEVMARPRG